MKTKMFFMRLVLYCTTACMVMCFSNCSEDSMNDVPEIPSEQQDNRGKVEFEIENESGEGEATSSSPVQVDNDTASVVLTQKSSYVDTDGTVFECEPKATAKAFTKLDTVYVDDISQLTQINEKADTETSVTGTSPIVSRTKYTFSNGKQAITFDLASEIYNFETKAKQKITMPYMLLSNAKYGKSSEVLNTESGPKTPPNAMLKAVRLTRATGTVDSTYNVSLMFNVDAESVNTKTTAKKNLDFEVNYVGVVNHKKALQETSKVTYETTINGEKKEDNSPIQVSGKETKLVISQKSRYTDTEGNVFEYEPQASVKVFTNSDTVVVKNTAELNLIDSNVKVNTSQKGENPIVTSTTQSFNIGSAQVINFIIDNETYLHATPSGKKREMPAVKLFNAEYGSALAKANGNSQVDASQIVKIEEVKVTRAIVTDTTLYQVKVKFNLPYKTVNVDSLENNSFDFEVNYIAAVKKDTYFPDTNSGKLSYETVINGRKGDIVSPIQVENEKTTVVWKQKSTFEDTQNKTFDCAPEATISLFAQLDTIVVSDVKELSAIEKEVKTTTNQKAEKTVTTQNFKIGKQNINCEIGYEAFPYTTNAGQEIVMPHVKLNNAEFYSSEENGIADAVQVIEIESPKSSRTLVTNKTYYQVKVRLNLLAETVNTKNPTKNSLDFEVNYIGVVETVTEKPEVVDTVYERSWVWAEAEYNLHLRHINTVTRKITYSNGETTVEEFPDLGHPVSQSASIDNFRWPYESNGFYITNQDRVVVDSIIYADNEYEHRGNNTDSIFYTKRVCYVSDLSLLNNKEIDKGVQNVNYGEYDKYPLSNYYNDEIAWYSCSILHRRYAEITYGEYLISRITINSGFQDQYLQIDGRKIEFKDLGAEKHWTLTVEDIAETATRGPGKKFRYECNSVFLGRNFSCVAEQIVYQYKK